MKRRGLLGAGLAAPMILGRSDRAAAQSTEKISVRPDWTSWGGQSPFYLALQKGWYRDAGLDVDIEEGHKPEIWLGARNHGAHASMAR